MTADSRVTLRQTAVLVALALALVAQQRVHREPFGILGWVLFVTAAGLGGAARWVDRARTAAVVRVPPFSGAGAQRLVLGTLAVVAVAATTILSGQQRWPLLALALWSSGLLAASVATRRWVVTPPARAPLPWSGGEVAALSGIVLIAASLRLLWLNDIPRYIFGDEARVGLRIAQDLHRQLHNVFAMSWNNWPVIGISLQGALVPVLGLSTLTLRLSSAMVGTLAVITTYLLTRELRTQQLALLAALLFAVGRTAIDFSRLGVCHAQVMLFETFAFFCWWRAINSGHALNYLWAGIGLGFCWYTYNAGLLAPFLWIGWITVCALRAPHLVRTHWRGALLTAGGFLLAQAPYLYEITDHFAFQHNWVEWTFMTRDRSLATQAVAAWQAGGSTAVAALVGNQAALTWLGFTSLPMGSYGLGYRGGGMLDDVSAALFVLGLGMSIPRLLHTRDAFVPYWWGLTTLVGGVLTTGAPAFVRLVGLLPALAILAAIPLDVLLHTCSPSRLKRRVAIALAGLVIVGASLDMWRTYFVDFAHALVDDTSELVRRLQQGPPQVPAFLFGSEQFLNLQSELFLMNFPDRVLVDVPDPVYQLPLHRPLESPVALVLGPTQVTLAGYLRSLYPHAQTETVMYYGIRPLFSFMRIAADDVAAHAGLQLSAYDASGALVTQQTADPFAPPLPGGITIARRHWEGRLYWPADHPTLLSVDAPRATAVRVASVTVEVAAGHTADATLELPMGWQPLSIDEHGPGEGALAMALRTNGTTLPVTRWDLNSNPAAEGLTAVYERDGKPVVHAIDPQLNAFAEEFLFRAPHDVAVRTPFAATWTGALRITTAGTYEFEAHASSPYAIQLDGAALLESTTASADQRQVLRTTRELSPGLHPLSAHWDSTGTKAPARRWFQLYWTPPHGLRELIPPPHFVPTAAAADQPIKPAAVVSPGRRLDAAP